MPYSDRTRRAFHLYARYHGMLLMRTTGRPSHLTIRRRALALETVGRRTGQVRTVALLYLPYGEDFVVLASNYGQEHPPAWWFNLQARPDAIVLWAGHRLRVRARTAEGDERSELLERARRYNRQWRDYLTSVKRTIPVVVLERVNR